MAQNSKIEWTDHTFNPWWGCTRVSAGCDHCYAASIAKRFKSAILWGPSSARKEASNLYWGFPYRWDQNAEAAGRRDRVFCGSMCDVFEDRLDMVSARARLLNLIHNTPNLDWLLLTKRPQNINKLWDQAATEWGEPGTLALPLPNVWLGATVENQAAADTRIPELLGCPARVRFLSCEPLLGPIKLDLPAGINWVIAGGESGPGARPTHPDWVRGLRDQCRAAGVPFFFKSWGSWRDPDGLLMRPCFSHPPIPKSPEV